MQAVPTSLGGCCSKDIARKKAGQPGVHPQRMRSPGLKGEKIAEKALPLQEFLKRKGFFLYRCKSGRNPHNRYWSNAEVAESPSYF